MASQAVPCKHRRDLSHYLPDYTHASQPYDLTAEQTDPRASACQLGALADIGYPGASYFQHEVQQVTGATVRPSETMLREAQQAEDRQQPKTAPTHKLPMPAGLPFDPLRSTPRLRSGRQAFALTAAV